MILDFTQYPTIPKHTQIALEDYLVYGMRPGRFLYSVLSDNLGDAVSSADSQNLDALTEIVRFIMNEFPTEAWGSSNKVNAYVKKTLSR